jgi:hypothetical protein
VAVLKEALVAAEKRCDAAAAAADAAAAVARMRDEKEIDLRSQVAALQRQQADASTAAAAAAAAASKREAVVTSLEQRCAHELPQARVDVPVGVLLYLLYCLKTRFNRCLIVRRLREALANASETQRGAQRAAAAAAADKDASERRLRDAEAKIQEMTAEIEAKEENVR